MSIDFTLTPELEALRVRVRDFIEGVVKPGEQKIGQSEDLDRSDYLTILIGMRG